MVVVFASRLLYIVWIVVAPLLVCAALCGDASAQVRFAQITDPHLFDRGEAGENARALSQCVAEINALDDTGPRRHDFVVVTGDLGVETLVEDAASRHASVDASLRAGAAAMAKILRPSRVATWLFVPGNNDLVDERPDSILYYHRFVALLARELEGDRIGVRDLCPPAAGSRRRARGARSGASRSAAYVVGAYTFVGFDDASFKNDNDPSRLGPEHRPAVRSAIDRAQAAAVESVKREVDASAGFAYVFFHIPNVDDPYLSAGRLDEKKVATFQSRLKKAGRMGALNLYSSWYVSLPVRRAWDAVANNDKVAGLFAGHFHDFRRETYAAREQAPGPGAGGKLHIAPPISVKRQVGAPLQARGFVDVSIDAPGTSAADRGRPHARIYWYDEKTGGFSSADEPARAAARVAR